MRLRFGNEDSHRHGTPSFMIGESHDDEPKTHPVHPITLRFVSKGELTRNHTNLIHTFSPCCVRGQISQSLPAIEVMAPFRRPVMDGIPVLSTIARQ